MTLNETIIKIAFSQFGTLEKKGSAHSERVLQYFDEIGHSWVKDDETAWCAAFANWVLLYALAEGTGKLNARSFLTIGEPVDIKDAVDGDIVILWRNDPKSPFGHVGFYTGQNSEQVFLAGGNQNNKVNIGGFSKSRILGVRRAKRLVKINQSSDS